MNYECIKCGIKKIDYDNGLNCTCTGGHEWWEEYFDGKLKITNKNGFVTIVPKNHETSTPLWCNICKFVMKTIDDTIYYKKYSCCYKCGLKWADARQKEWSNGWRPPEKQVAEEIEFRKSLPLSIDFDILNG